MLNACSLNIHVYHIFHYKIVYKKIISSMIYFIRMIWILLNVGAGLYSIYAQQFQIMAITTPSGGEHVTQDINKHSYKLVTFIRCVTISTIIHILHIWETKYNWYTQLYEIFIIYIYSITSDIYVAMATT